MIDNDIAARDDDVVLDVRDIVKHFEVSVGTGLIRGKGLVKAVDGVSFAVKRGETLGIVGESGCGKSTAARVVLRLLESTSGEVWFKGKDVLSINRKELRSLRRDMQIVFQDPYASLNPRMTVRDIIGEGLRVWKMDQNLDKDVAQLLTRVGLNPAFAKRYPHEFSGGQRQRIGIARALATRPELIICDEPVSALDVSVQAQILNLLVELQKEFDLALVFIAHDLSVVRHIADRVAVMYLGKIVEIGTRDEVFNSPTHPYTQALLSAVPIPDPKKERIRTRIPLTGEPPSPLDPPSGCRFHPRCWKATDICMTDLPDLTDRGFDHDSACHHAEALEVL